MITDLRLNREMAETKFRYDALQRSEGGALKSLAENRAQQARLLQYWCEGAPDIDGKVDVVVPTRHGAIHAKLFVPKRAEYGPVAIFLHGGGWARGSTANGEWACQAVAYEAGLRVLSLNYSLAPEKPYPTALEEIQDAMEWCREQGAALAIDGSRFVLFGASAGANLSLASALMSRDQGKPLPRALGLIYGVFSNDFETDSYIEFGVGQFGLSLARMREYFEWYVPTGVEVNQPYITPIIADLRGMPPSWIGFGALDVLRDDSIGIDQKLRAAGVETCLRCYDDLPHGFATYARTIGRAREALADLAGYLRERAF